MSAPSARVMEAWRRQRVHPEGLRPRCRRRLQLLGVNAGAGCCPCPTHTEPSSPGSGRAAGQAAPPLLDCVGHPQHGVQGGPRSQVDDVRAHHHELGAAAALPRGCLVALRALPASDLARQLRPKRIGWARWRRSQSCQRLCGLPAA